LRIEREDSEVSLKNVRGRVRSFSAIRSSNSIDRDWLTGSERRRREMREDIIIDEASTNQIK
jgi:hypothetical protein